jgi:hypothetical protein
VDPVDHRTVQSAGRAEQAVHQVTGSAPGGQRGTEPFDGAGRGKRPQAEQDHPGEAHRHDERLVTGSDAEGRAVVDDQLEPEQPPGEGDPVSVAQRGPGPCLGRRVGGQAQQRHAGGQQDASGRKGGPVHAA